MLFQVWHRGDCALDMRCRFLELSTRDARGVRDISNGARQPDGSIGYGPPWQFSVAVLRPGALAPWASAEASPVSTGPRDPATSGTARTAQPCQARTRLGIPAAPRLLAWAGINPILGSQLACTDGERRQRHTQTSCQPCGQPPGSRSGQPLTAPPRAGEGVPPVCSSLQVRQGQAQEHGLGWRAGQWAGRALATYRQWAR